MSKSYTYLFLAPLLLAAPAWAGTVTQTNLTSDGSVKAAFTDPNLVNPWGISYSPTGDFWVSDNATGLTTLYDGTGKPQSLVVTIPPGAGEKGPSAPTGQVFNSSSTEFEVTEGGKTGAAAFIFATENGTVSGWSPSVDVANAVQAIDNSKSKAVYKAVAIVPTGSSEELMVTNFRSGMVEIYDSNFKPVSQFRDTGAKGVKPIPADYAPYNVAVLNGNIYVTYAKQNHQKHDSKSGPHLGYVDQVAADGTLIKRIAARGALNAPWGLAIAPSSFGSFAGALLVGNFGDGWINAYSLTSGKYLGYLQTSKGPLSIDGLWAIIPGNGGSGGSTSDLYFTAGPDGETHGLFGSLTYTP
jgi:uncharacterized protein (TIGR03118 family)